MATILQKKEAAVTRAKNIALNAKANGVDLTQEEINEIDSIVEEVKGYNEQIAKAEAANAKLGILGSRQKMTDAERTAYNKKALESPENRDALGNIKNGWTTDGQVVGNPQEFIKNYYASEGKNMSTGTKATDRTPATRRAKAQTISVKLRENVEAKGMFAPGSIVEPISVFDKPQLQPHEQLLSLSSLLETKVLPKGQFSYIRQTARDHKAAPVAMGAEKPVSTYSFEEVKGELKTIATISEPLHNQWLWDYPEVVASMIEEMMMGLVEAEDGQLLNGDGAGANLTGLLNTVGIQTQAAGADELATLRGAITKLEVLGFIPSATLLNPLDWERIELQTNAGTGEYTLTNAPVDRAARRIWGVPVLPHTSIPQGTALTLDGTAAHVLRGQMTHVDAAPFGDDFKRNQVHVRIEERIELAVTKPLGVIKIALPAVTP